MDDRVAKLQPRVRALHRGQAGSQIRYPEDLRAEIIAVARAGRTAGRSVYRLAREIGVSAPALSEWLRRPTRGHLRQVAVAPATVTTMTSTRNPVVVTPHGFRIEGLDLIEEGVAVSDAGREASKNLTVVRLAPTAGPWIQRVGVRHCSCGGASPVARAR